MLDQLGTEPAVADVWGCDVSAATAASL